MYFFTLLSALSLGISHAAPAPTSTLPSIPSPQSNDTDLAIGLASNLTARAEGWDIRDPRNPSHWFDCTVKYSIFYDRITVKDDIRDWDKKLLGENGEGLKRELKGCGAMTGWQYWKPDYSKMPYKFQAQCNLPIGVQACVLRAIKTAGAPSRAKCRTGQLKTGG